MVQMLVLRSQYLSLCVMLGMEHLIDEVWFMMVIDDAKNSDYFMVTSDFLVDGLGTYHRSKRIRSVRVEFPPHLIIYQL